MGGVYALAGKAVSASAAKIRGAEAIWLDGFRDPAGSQTPRANTQTPGCTIDQCLHRLEVWTEDALGLIVRVTHIMTALMSFAAEIASIRHGTTPSSS